METVHHPGIHFGPIDVDWGALVVPLGALLLIVVASLLPGGAADIAPVSGIIDSNLAP